MTIQLILSTNVKPALSCNCLDASFQISHSLAWFPSRPLFYPTSEFWHLNVNPIVEKISSCTKYWGDPQAKGRQNLQVPESRFHLASLHTLHTMPCFERKLRKGQNMNFLCHHHKYKKKVRTRWPLRPLLSALLTILRNIPTLPFYICIDQA